MLYIAYEHSYQYGTFNKSTSIINRKLRFCGPGGGRCGFAAQGAGLVVLGLGADVRLFNVGDYISGMESPMAVSWLLCVAVFWRPAYIILAVIYIYIFICKY